MKIKSQNIVTVLLSVLLCVSAVAQSNSPAPTFSVRAADGSYQVTAPGNATPVLISEVGAEVNHQWLLSSSYPHHVTTQSPFMDSLGSGRSFTTTFSGLSGSPELAYTLRVYSGHPYGIVSVTVLNTTLASFHVGGIRVVDAVGAPKISLGSSESEDRVLADSFSEDPTIRIGDLSQAPHGVYFGVRSVLIYNQHAKQSLLVAALTSNRFLTVSHLRVAAPPAADPVIASFTVDCTGTTEAVLQRDPIPAAQQVALSLPVEAGQSITSESELIAAGPDYLKALEAYGGAVRRLHHPRIAADAPIGWWSWTAFYGGINEGESLTNARWLSAHLKQLGYDYFHIDEGYDYARGEYTTANATQFPGGMRKLEYQIRGLGLVPGLWTAPFEVSVRSWVFEHHPDWLVDDANGKPILIGYVHRNVDPLYALDTTNPGAQAYLRSTYRTLTREWGVRYVKLDFMDSSAIEGYHYRPNTTALEAQRIGLRIIRDAVGSGVLVDKDGSPMLNPVGLVDEGRIAPDTGHSFQASMDAAPNVAARFYMNRDFYRSDPDAFSVSEQVEPQQSYHQARKGLSLNEAQVQIVLAAVAGGMYEIGDDLPTLGAEPRRLALVENHELIDMSRIGRAATPLDLMTFPAADLEPSVFFLREDARQAMLAVFDWSGETRPHSFDLAALGFAAGHPVHAYDVLAHDAPAAVTGAEFNIENQPRSVRLIKLVDTSIAPAAPMVSAQAPVAVATGHAFHLTAGADGSPVPAVEFRWDFGDGTGATGRDVVHTYTKPGVYTAAVTVRGIDGISARKSFTIRSNGLANTAFHLDLNRRYVPASGQ